MKLTTAHPTDRRGPDFLVMRSGGRPLGRRHDDGGVEDRMSMAWVPGCRRHLCPKAPRRSLRIVVVSGGCPVRESIEAFVT